MSREVHICTCNHPDCQAQKINYPAMRSVRKLARQHVADFRTYRLMWRAYHLDKATILAMLTAASTVQYRHYMSKHVQILEVPEEVFEMLFGSTPPQRTQHTIH